MIAARLIALAAAGCATLALAGPSLASYAPRLVVDPASNAVGASGPMTVSFSQRAADLPTAQVTVYAPAGAAAPSPAAPGEAVGTATASGTTAVFGPFAMKGRLTAADPTVDTTGACVPGSHAQVWMLTLAGAGETLKVPISVDRTSGAETALGGLKLDLCLAAPASADGVVTLVRLDLHLKAGVLRSPRRPGAPTWRSFFTPYPAGSLTPDPATMVESRSLLRQPLGLTLLGKLGKHNRVLLFGSLTGGGRGLAGVDVTLLAGRTAGAQKPVSSTHTSSAGTYTFGTKLKRTTIFRAQVTVPAEDVTSTGCKGASRAPGGCVTATMMPLHLLSATAVKVSVGA